MEGYIPYICKFSPREYQVSYNVCLYDNMAFHNFLINISVDLVCHILGAVIFRWFFFDCQ